MSKSKWAKDLTGQRFGALTALRHVGHHRQRGYAIWLCRCDCGKEREVQSCHLTEGRIQACNIDGHRWVEPGKAARANLIGRHPSEHGSWRKMIERCDNPDRHNYSAYGGRGIAVCERWRSSFAAFLEDMGPKASPDLTIERNDNDGNYEPGNCRWATRAEQRRNMRCTLFVEMGGERVKLVDLIDMFELDGPLIRRRLEIGWSIEEALTIPRQPQGRPRKNLRKETP